VPGPQKFHTKQTTAQKPSTTCGKTFECLRSWKHAKKSCGGAVKKKLEIAQSKKDPSLPCQKTSGTGKAIVCNCGDANLTAGEGSAVKKAALLLKEGEDNSGKLGKVKN
jgi:hypothetical protein